MPKINIQSRKDIQLSSKSYIWNTILIGLVFCLVMMLTTATKNMGSAFALGSPQHIYLATSALPGYALRSVTRMFYALLLSLFATFTLGTLAAKSKYAERIIIPLIDILQSIPILGFLSICIPLFLHLFPNSLWGPECAAIITIFTSQVWNMILSFYQSLKTVPKNMQEVAKIFQLNNWQKFWRIEVPFAMPGLLWNTMLSLSAGWFFVVGSEAFIYNGSEILLPGIGSFIAKAVDLSDSAALYKAVLTMLIIITIYDQLIFRPMIAWAQKFNLSGDHRSSQSSWLLTLLGKSSIWRIFNYLDFNTKKISKSKFNNKYQINPRMKNHIWQAFVFFSGLMLLILSKNYLFQTLVFSKILHVITLGAWTMLRVFFMILLCCLIWVPIGVYIGLRPGLALKVQPFIQFLAAFPTNLLFPFMIGLIIKYNLNINIWAAPLLVLGTQWYILFNVIAGTMNLSEDLHDIAAILKVRDLLWWRKLIIPGIFPHLLTGIISAAGGAWNASILAEALSWGNNNYYADGLGAFITYTQKNGQVDDMALGIIIMCAYVLLINRIIWQPLYRLSQKRFTD